MGLFTLVWTSVIGMRATRVLTLTVTQIKSNVLPLAISQT